MANTINFAADPIIGSNAGVDLPPAAPMLMQSLRSVGYTMPAALADLVDNSIAANAGAIAIRFSASPEPFIAVIDDGRGLDREGLVAAMRFGSRDPRDFRSGTDLGRFGLGLKTASLSQCRRLTVASLVDGRVSVAVWDLDECDRRQAWWLDTPGTERVHPEVLQALTSHRHGTAVIWQNLDRLLPERASDLQQALDKAMEGAADHLALCFHRFLAGEFGKTVGIAINDRPLPGLDPFLTGHARGQSLHAESFEVDGHKVTVSPFVLPFPSRLNAVELERAGGRDSLKSAHGFYVYRGGRLVVPGGWFRIVPADELVRLARIRVDIPVELDHIWKVDVRKTMAEPPPAIRPELKRIVGTAAARSRMVYTYRGTPANVERVPIWIRHDLRGQAAAWRINREHPIVAALAAGDVRQADFERLLALMESTLPLHDIHIHISNDLPVVDPDVPSEAELEELARRLVASFQDMPMALAGLLAKLPVTEPFSRNQDAAQRIAARLAA